MSVFRNFYVSSTRHDAKAETNWRCKNCNHYNNKQVVVCESCGKCFSPEFER